MQEGAEVGELDAKGPSSSRGGGKPSLPGNEMICTLQLQSLLALSGHQDLCGWERALLLCTEQGWTSRKPMETLTSCLYATPSAISQELTSHQLKVNQSTSREQNGGGVGATSTISPYKFH